MGDELVEVPRGVREEADQDPPLAQEVQHRQRVVVELEVLRAHPAPLHLGRGPTRVALAAHPDDDPLGEENPDLLVVVELGMALELADRSRARLLVARRVEVEPVAEPKPLVALRPEIGPGPRKSEVDVEDHRAKHNREATRPA